MKEEENYLVCKGSLPVAWLKLNGLDGRDVAWISMLAVGERFHRQGIGTFAIRFAEEACKSRGYVKMAIHAAKDHFPVQSLYRKMGYTEQDDGFCYTYWKTL